MMKFTKVIFLLVAILCHTAVAQTNPPVGVRPCCAFGYDLKAQLGGIPVPFFSVGNVVDADQIGQHHYNDGSQSVSGNLLGFGDEQNGLIFTQEGGFIDTAHVRDTADFTFFLYQQNRERLGQTSQIDLTQELRTRQIIWQAHSNELSASEQARRSAQAAALVAFQLAQWHEIAQWFGLVSVGGFDELASAYSPEDLYSNMLGAKLAKAILLADPAINRKDFSTQLDSALQAALKELKAENKSVTKQKIEALDGIWWDSSRRLPDKWLLLKRDYQFSYTLQPNYPGATHRLSLDEHFDDGSRINDWVSLQLVASDNETAFAGLPDSLASLPVWQHEQLAQLTKFAYQHDERAHPQQVSPQVGEE
ncbi:hypothetical protein ATY35_11225 [Vibrio cidicii]|uniref:DUF4056 domain-containing protein n=2 Tax=Vibrio cidicii TaxID=1763883 RepID=A0ABR5W7K9_9VIBR|nr:DUF4056 domain-containing protein [Vibrio cidicii]KYN89516.1 hypothetical protein ATY35_11225 [Vibrio cidicii]